MVDRKARLQSSEQGPPRRDPSAVGINLRTPLITPTRFTTTIDTTIGGLIVACVFWGDKYDIKYVQRLKLMVERNLSVPHRFICLSDKDIEGIDCIPIFATKWEGWWQKVALFTPQLFPSGTKVLYLDLDVIITGSIDVLAYQRTECPLAMIYNFGPNRSHCAHNSSVMQWTSGDPRLNGIHDFFTEDVMRKLHGDQCWIWRVLRDNIANWPMEYIKSYKYDCRGKTLDDSIRIVVFHGDPKPHQINEAWAALHWG